MLNLIRNEELVKYRISEDRPPATSVGPSITVSNIANIEGS